MDEEKKIEEAVKVQETAAQEATESAKEADKAAEKAESSAEEAKEAVEEVKEVIEEVKEAVEEVKEKEQEKPKPETKKNIVVSGKLGDIITQIEKLTVLELADLVKALEEKFGVSAAAPVAVAAGPAAAGTGEAADEGQTTFNVVLADGGANKISVIKAVRELVPTLGLKEAKDLVDAAPKPVLEGIGKEAANEAKTKLEAAGGKVELK